MRPSCISVRNLMYLKSGYQELFASHQLKAKLGLQLLSETFSYVVSSIYKFISVNSGRIYNKENTHIGKWNIPKKKAAFLLVYQPGLNFVSNIKNNQRGTRLLIQKHINRFFRHSADRVPGQYPIWGWDNNGFHIRYR